jgi:SAM-dependent methyltransferase
VTATDRWRSALASWSWPPEILAHAPVSPWTHDPASFADRAARAAGRDAPGDAAAREALPRLGSVLDVGCGGGAATVALGRRGRTVVGVDPSPAMLDAFRVRVGARWRRVRTHEGRWPEVAAGGAVARCDVVVCHDVVYDVAELGPFVRALTTHASRRVVVVLPQVHPLSWLTPYAEQLHGVSRPREPDADLAADVVRETGQHPRLLRWREPTRWGTPGAADAAALLATARRRLCLPASRDDELRRALDRTPPPTMREAVALVWET